MLWIPFNFFSLARSTARFVVEVERTAGMLEGLVRLAAGLLTVAAPRLVRVVLQEASRLIGAGRFKLKQVHTYGSQQ